MVSQPTDVFKISKNEGSSPYTLPSEPFWYSYRTLTFWNKNGAAARSSGMGIGGRSLPLNRRKGSGKYFWKNFFSVPRPAGVNFFIINIVPERTPKKIFRGFIARQNAVFVLCIRMVWRQRVRDETRQVAEILNSAGVRNHSPVRPREKIPLSLATRGVLCRDVEKRTTCRALQVVRFRSDQCPACGAWYEITSKKREPANRPSTLLPQI